jgi:hypothetical protein
MRKLVHVVTDAEFAPHLSALRKRVDVVTEAVQVACGKGCPS